MADTVDKVKKTKAQKTAEKKKKLAAVKKTVKNSTVKKKQVKNKTIKTKTHLTEKELKFINVYMETGNATRASQEAGYVCKSVPAHATNGNYILRKQHIQNEIKKRRAKEKANSIATSKEVLEFFTKAMNGEIKDQFGLEASLGDRIKAGQELAKRTVDIDNRLAGKADAKVEIKVDWKRD